MLCSTLFVVNCTEKKVFFILKLLCSVLEIKVTAKTSESEQKGESKVKKVWCCC